MDGDGSVGQVDVDGPFGQAHPADGWCRLGGLVDGDKHGTPAGEGPVDTLPAPRRIVGGPGVGDDGELRLRARGVMARQDGRLAVAPDGAGPVGPLGHDVEIGARTQLGGEPALGRGVEDEDVQQIAPVGDDAPCRRDSVVRLLAPAGVAVEDGVAGLLFPLVDPEGGVGRRTRVVRAQVPVGVGDLAGVRLPGGAVVRVQVERQFVLVPVSAAMWSGVQQGVDTRGPEDRDPGVGEGVPRRRRGKRKVGEPPVEVCGERGGRVTFGCLGDGLQGAPANSWVASAATSLISAACASRR